MASILNAFLTAVMLLTRIPVARWVRFSPEAASASIAFFPAVGALIGSVAAGAWLIAFERVPVLGAILFSMLSSILLTGALHEDGLADAADGLFGGQTPEQRMTIMKDSRMGTFGGIALWFSLTLRLVLLWHLSLGSAPLTAEAILWSHTFARWAAVCLLQNLPHVGPDALRAKDFCKKLPLPRLLLALVPPVILLVSLHPRVGSSVLFLLTLLVLYAIWFLRRKLGGLTGDCVGATTQLAEIATLGSFAAAA